MLPAGCGGQCAWNAGHAVFLGGGPERARATLAGVLVHPANCAYKYVNVACVKMTRARMFRNARAEVRMPEQYEQQPKNPCSYPTVVPGQPTRSHANLIFIEDFPFFVQ